MHGQVTRRSLQNRLLGRWWGYGLAVLMLAMQAAQGATPSAAYCWPDEGNLIVPPMQNVQPRFLCPLGPDGALISVTPADIARKGARITATVPLDNGSQAGFFIESRPRH